MDYTITAIPTTYNGRLYRSRLEAKWAAFFDLLGWSHEYEPFDLGAWSPDFLVKPLGLEYLTEIKPITEFHNETGDKMLRAVVNKVQGPRYRGIYLFGVCPELALDGKAVRIGWTNPISEDGAYRGWRPNYIVWWQHSLTPSFSPMTVREEMLSVSDYRSYPEHTMNLWADATSRAQWHPEGSRT